MTQASEQAVQEKEDRTIRIMRSVVINMGILLVIGTIALFVAVIIKSSSSLDKKVKSASQTQPAKESNISSQCMEYTQADIPLMGKIISSDTSNGILTITTTAQVIAYDLCNGKVIAKFQSVGNN